MLSPSLAKFAAVALAILLVRTARGSDDIVFADFEGHDYGAWKVEGEAFGPGPAQGTLPHEKPVTGFLGHGLVNSFYGGDRSTGRLTSPRFKIERRYITFLIGGGGWEGKTCINLLIDGTPVHTATGPHTKPGGTEALALAFWDVGPLQGKQAQIEIVDQATGTWGHICIDQIVFTDVLPQPAARPSTQESGVASTEPAAHDVTEAHDTPWSQDGELLYNGIRLPKEWPPHVADPKSRAVRPAPYLEHPPAEIVIDVGRQLFVDDFLIQATDLKRTYHHAERYEKNPVLFPTTKLELNGGKRPCATVFDDGVWFDPKDRLFKMWYHAGWYDGTALATSKDGLTWERPELDVVKGTNRVIAAEGRGQRDGCAVWLDPGAADPSLRFKMFLYERPAKTFGGQIFTSPDGIHWERRAHTPSVGDNTTVLYNPFRKKWVYSVRVSAAGRARAYRECDDLIAGANWAPADLVPWAKADERDLPDPKIGTPPELYTLDAVGYESLMLGVFGIFRGPQNPVALERKIPKTNDLELAFSRDGFHWDRPDRTPFIASTRRDGDWDRAYLHPAATICAIVGDKLYFYYGGWSGKRPDGSGDMYAGGATGVAFLRRDGFASLDAADSPGTVLTRPLRFAGRYLFVNLNAPNGELRAEVLDAHDNVIQPFSLENCIPLHADSTRQKVTWHGADDLAAVSGKPVRMRFQLKCGSLYAFWVTPDERGASHGYVAAGGPEFDRARDEGR